MVYLCFFGMYNWLRFMIQWLSITVALVTHPLIHWKMNKQQFRIVIIGPTLCTRSWYEKGFCLLSKMTVSKSFLMIVTGYLIV